MLEADSLQSTVPKASGDPGSMSVEDSRIETSPSLFLRAGGSVLFLRLVPIIGLLLRRILDCCSKGTTCVSEADFVRDPQPLLASLGASGEVVSGTRFETPRGATSILNVMVKGTVILDTLLEEHQDLFRF